MGPAPFLPLQCHGWAVAEKRGMGLQRPWGTGCARRGSIHPGAVPSDPSLDDGASLERPFVLRAGDGLSAQPGMH